MEEGGLLITKHFFCSAFEECLYYIFVSEEYQNHIYERYSLN